MKITSWDDLSRALDEGELLDVSQDARDASWPADVMMTAQAHAALVGDASDFADEPGREALGSTMRAVKAAIVESQGCRRVPAVVAIPERGKVLLVTELVTFEDETTVVIALPPESGEIVLDEVHSLEASPKSRRHLDELLRASSGPRQVPLHYLDDLGPLSADQQFPTCSTCGEADVEDAGDHADRTGHWPTSVAE